MRLFTLLFIFLSFTLCAQDQTIFTEEEVSIELKEGILYGTLCIPVNARKKTPIVLIIPGSGPTDRDCNSAIGIRSDAFLMLAHGLAKDGIASLRVDKRISGKSAATFKSSNDTLKFDDLIEDNQRWMAWIRADKRFGELTVCGHSQGALTGMIAALEDGTDRYISLCGAGKPADELMRSQIIASAPAHEAVIHQFFDSLVAGSYDETAPFFLRMTVSKDQAGYLAQYSAYDPAYFIKELKCPVLIVQAGRDLQIPLEDAELLHARSPQSELAVIPEMNHVLKVSPEDRQGNIDTYGQYQLPLHADLLPILTRFILGN